jgi:endonuclease YncB( thermonuclease family)
MVHLWACGKRAQVALYNATKMQRLTCIELSRDARDSLVAECKANEVAISAWLVANGWATPDEDNEGYRAELAQARSERRGLWNGNWQVRS